MYFGYCHDWGNSVHIQIKLNPQIFVISLLLFSSNRLFNLLSTFSCLPLCYGLSITCTVHVAINTYPPCFSLSALQRLIGVSISTVVLIWIIIQSRVKSLHWISSNRPFLSNSFSYDDDCDCFSRFIQLLTRLSILIPGRCSVSVRSVCFLSIESGLSWDFYSVILLRQQS